MTMIVWAAVGAVFLFGLAMAFWPSRRSGDQAIATTSGDYARASDKAVSVQGSGNTVHVTHSANGKTSAVGDADGRKFLPATVTVAALVDALENETSVAADAIGRRYVDLWMRFDCTVRDVSTSEFTGEVSIRVRVEGYQWSISCKIREQDSKLALVKRIGDAIQLEAQIASLGRLDISFKNSELI